MTQDNRLWVLMSRCLSGEATPEETEELQVLLKHAPDKQYLFGVLSAYFTDHPPGADKQTSDPGLEERFRRIVDVNYPDVSGKNDKKYLHEEGLDIGLNIPSAHTPHLNDCYSFIVTSTIVQYYVKGYVSHV